jgi:hypothetical protein
MTTNSPYQTTTASRYALGRPRRSATTYVVTSGSATGELFSPKPEFLKASGERADDAALRTLLSERWAEDWNSPEDAKYDF